MTQANIWELPGYENHTVAFLTKHDRVRYGTFPVDGVNGGVGVDPLGGLWVRNNQLLHSHGKTPGDLGSISGAFAVVWTRHGGSLYLHLSKAAYSRIVQLDSVPGIAWRKVDKVYPDYPEVAASAQPEEVPA